MIVILCNNIIVLGLHILNFYTRLLVLEYVLTLGPAHVFLLCRYVWKCWWSILSSCLVRDGHPAAQTALPSYWLCHVPNSLLVMSASPSP